MTCLFFHFPFVFVVSSEGISTLSLIFKLSRPMNSLWGLKAESVPICFVSLFLSFSPVFRIKPPPSLLRQYNVSDEWFMGFSCKHYISFCWIRISSSLSSKDQTITCYRLIFICLKIKELSIDFLMKGWRASKIIILDNNVTSQRVKEKEKSKLFSLNRHPCLEVKWARKKRWKN